MSEPDTTLPPYPYGEVTRARATDERGRVILAHMTDREIAEETLWHMRQLADFLMDFAQSPMSRMIPGANGLAALNLMPPAG